MTQSALVLVANSKDGSIATFRLADGVLERLVVTQGLTGCSTFAVDPDHDLVYAGVKGAHDGEPAAIVTLALDRANGSLTEVSRRPLEGPSLNYVTLTRGGTGLLAASYAGGYGLTATVRDGVVSTTVSQIRFANLHSVIASADGAFAYFVSLGEDLIAQYALGANMTLTPLAPETVAAPEGTGPRHPQLSESGDTLYVITEFTAEVLRFARNVETGTLNLLQVVPTADSSKGLIRSRFGLDPTANHAIWGADLHLGAADPATGTRYLWASERSESTLGAVAIAADGTLRAPESFTVTQPQPRGFALSPDGAYLVAAGERSTSVSLYAVDGPRLELLQQAETGRVANWVRFI